MSPSSSAFPTALPTKLSSPRHKSRLSHADSCTDADVMTDPGTGYLNAQDAAALDVDLMSSPGFSLEQLMELAGLAVAEVSWIVSCSISMQR